VINGVGWLDERYTVLHQLYNFLFSALRHVPSNDPLARHNRIVPCQTHELRDVVHAEEYLGAACSLFSGVDLEAGSCVAAKQGSHFWGICP